MRKRRSDKKTKENIEIFAEYSSGCHVISSAVKQKLLGSNSQYSIKRIGEEFDFLSKTSPAMKVFLNDTEKTMCTVFVIPAEEVQVLPDQYISYLQGLLKNSGCTGPDHKDN